MSIDYMAVQDLEPIPGVQKYTIGCNWKFAVDNVWDWYHLGITHASAAMASPGRRRGGISFSRDRFLQPQMAVLGDYGHAIGGPRDEESAEAGPSGRGLPVKARAEIGDVGMKIGGHPHIFPNLWFMRRAVILRLPKGPTKTEIWRIALVDKNMSAEEKRQSVYQAIRWGQGPAGMNEQEDGENWVQSTTGTMGTVIKNHPLNYALNLGRGEVIEDESGPPHIETNMNEHAQLWYYRAWSEWMAAGS